MTSEAAARPITAAVREMRWWDIEAVHAIELSAFPDTPWTQEQFWSELAQVPNSRTLLVATGADAPVIGYADLRAVGREADVMTIAVSAAHRGHGVGHLLLSALIDDAVRRGCASIFLEVRADNAPAIRLYHTAGFVRIDVRRDYYAPGVDADVMRRSL
jgi:ribosomal-protein-alanine N-acetyltransferase